MASDFSTTLILSETESLNLISSFIHPNQDALNKRDSFLKSYETMDVNINIDGSMDIYVPDLFLPMSFSLSSTITTNTSVVLDTPKNPVEFNYTYDTTSSLTTDSDYTYTNDSASPDTDFIRTAA